MSEPLLTRSEDGTRCELHSPTAMPAASAYLWNRHMLLQANCRGFVSAQHLQPEPARYSFGPMLEATTFMQPEQPRYAHQPGRFFYIKNEHDGQLVSLPFEPVRRAADAFCFSAGSSDLEWRIRYGSLICTLTLRLPVNDVVELWSLLLHNEGAHDLKFSLYPCFSIGYMSWMNQSASYRADLGGILARCVTPYQRVEDLPRILQAKDLTFLLHEREPQAWEAARERFEGEGGLHDPDALRQPLLGGGDALYESPLAVLQYRTILAPGESICHRFLFGAARTEADVRVLRERYLTTDAFDKATRDSESYHAAGQGVLQVTTPDPAFDAFVNHWLPRQVHYHGELHRMSTDPQTRNLLQDAMGMSFVRPPAARAALLLALSQQEPSGAMPDGILLHATAQLKYINCVPHTDHCVWLPVFLDAYLDETDDHALLDAPVAGRHDGVQRSVAERITAAMHRLLAETDARGLSYIGQGDWCDPMNMVGHLGRGVSGWLSIASVHALRLWAARLQARGEAQPAQALIEGAQRMADAVQRHLWDGAWFGRGITDAGVTFGVSSDREGRIFLNPQSWSMLADIATPAQREAMLAAIAQQLDTAYGVMLCAPPYTALRDDVGRVTQKFPGTAENGSIYNHAAAFFAAALYRVGEADRAFSVLRRMLPSDDAADQRQRGQLPVFLPNYYRGAVELHPRTAGRSSQLLHTGTASWFYRCVIEQLFGLRGCREGLRITPQLPAHWNHARATRRFRGAHIELVCQRGSVWAMQVDGETFDEPLLRDPQAGRSYRIELTLPIRSDL
ncbi:MAG: GH36-type glycosyl hydrolase domain-containing protein [Pseudomarimonas sp.]